MTRTRIHLRLDTREWNWEIAGNLTAEAIAEIVKPVKAANPHNNSLLVVTRTPRWVDVATRVADWWLARSGWLRLAAYALSVALVVAGWLM